MAVFFYICNKIQASSVICKNQLQNKRDKMKYYLVSLVLAIFIVIELTSCKDDNPLGPVEMVSHLHKLIHLVADTDKIHTRRQAQYIKPYAFPLSGGGQGVG